MFSMSFGSRIEYTFIQLEMGAPSKDSFLELRHCKRQLKLFKVPCCRQFEFSMTNLFSFSLACVVMNPSLLLFRIYIYIYILHIELLILHIYYSIYRIYVVLNIYILLNINLAIKFLKF